MNTGILEKVEAIENTSSTPHVWKTETGIIKEVSLSLPN